MEWISITTSCFATSNAIAKTAHSLHAFVREVRESRADLDAISAELHSLDGVLDLLKDDAACFPEELLKQTPSVLMHCLANVNELEGYLSILNGHGISRLDKKFRWIATRKQIGKLRFTLEGYKSTLGLALDLVALTTPHTPHDIEGGSERSAETDAHGDPRNHQLLLTTPADDPEVRGELLRVVADLQQLSARLQGESQDNAAVMSLQSYCDVLHTHAEGLGLGFDPAQFERELESLRKAPSSIGDAPDSAIEMGEEPVFPPVARGTPQSSQEEFLPIDEIDELLDELNEMPERPPTPPPKAPRRNSSVRSSNGAPSLERPSTDDSTYSSERGVQFEEPTALQPPRVPARGSSLSSPSKSPSELSDRVADDIIRPVTVLGEDTVSVLPARPSSRVGRMFSHRRNARSASIQASNASIITAAPTGHAATVAASTVAPSTATSVIGRRFSLTVSSIKSFSSYMPLRPHVPSWRKDAAAAVDEPPEPDAIFGVSLSKSMQVALASAKATHSDEGSSRRDFPLCVFKCYAYIMAHGVEAPHIFGEGGDPDKLVLLKEAFSTGPTYGEDVDWDDFGPLEAADIIVLFLSQLKRPLVGEAVAKRWISLSKQASLPGDYAARLEQCIDFWEEALLGIRGASRSLFKLLLNMWGEIADAHDVNGMTAERLAGRVIRPLMHTSPERYDTDFLLGLAFLIRKRSEYSMLARGGIRKSNAAF